MEYHGCESVASREAIEDIFGRQIDAAAGERGVDRERLAEAVVETQFALAEEPGPDAPPERVAEDARVAMAITIDEHDSLLAEDDAPGIVSAVRSVHEMTVRRDARFETAGGSIHPLGVLVKPTDDD